MTSWRIHCSAVLLSYVDVKETQKIFELIWWDTLNRPYISDRGTPSFPNIQIKFGFLCLACFVVVVVFSINSPISETLNAAAVSEIEGVASLV